MASSRELEVFYQTQTPTLRALSRNAEWQFVLGHLHGADDAKTIRHTPLPLHPAQTDIDALRGSQDRVAVFERYAWPGYAGCAGQYRTPPSWHRELEQIRCEVHAARYLAGVRRNLFAYYSRRPAITDRRTPAYWTDLIRAGVQGWREPPADTGLTVTDNLKKLSQLIERPFEYHQYGAEFFQACGAIGLLEDAPVWKSVPT